MCDSSGVGWLLVLGLLLISRLFWLKLVMLMFECSLCVS